MSNLTNTGIPPSEFQEWCRRRHWFPRVLMLGWFGWMTLHQLSNADYHSFLGGLNLGIHEFGHLLCGPMGELIGVAGGSLVQCLIPLISFWMFHRQQDYFAHSFSFVWLGSNLFEVARYMGDARKLALPLVSPFSGNGEVIHDWNYLFHKMGMLQWDTSIALLTRALSSLCMITGLIWGAWVVWQILRTPRREIGSNWVAPA